MSLRFQRIHVTGNAGAGKTTLAKRLGDQLDLPVRSLDSILWKSGWQKATPEERLPLEDALLREPRWVLDGVSARAREVADVILVLDVSTSVCLARASLRTLKHLTHQRPEFPAGCPEWRIYPTVARIILRFERVAGRQIRRDAEREPGRYRTITSTRDVDDFLAEAAKPS